MTPQTCSSLSVSYGLLNPTQTHQHYNLLSIRFA
jgi:hypothetical protein